MSNFQNYVLVWRVLFKLEVSRNAQEPPAGFLFLCPPEDFKTEPSSYRWPGCPAYWSLDPSGVDRLTLEEATRLGFPAFQFTNELWGKSWDASVYEGLRKFYRAKGLDPDSQELAQQLGYPLYELASEADSTFVQGDFEEVDKEDWDAKDNPRAETLTDEDVDSEVSSSLSENDEITLVRTVPGSAHPVEESNGKNPKSESQAPNASSVVENRSDRPTLYTEMHALSGTFKFLVNAQLALISFLMLSWLYEHM
ncbi:hypothetical protein B0H14DRAFT_2713484 [Mycena olivaceomarginata]|nr:hypothetical protein B0H14DRAFT_2713484 [Mycena olivaceomarginata]